MRIVIYSGKCNYNLKLILDNIGNVSISKDNLNYRYIISKTNKFYGYEETANILNLVFDTDIIDSQLFEANDYFVVR